MAVEELTMRRQETDGGRGTRAGGAPRAEAIRILCAEDNPTNQRVLAAIMSPFNAVMHMVDNGLDAVDAWERGGFDLIFMDIQMPVLDGVQATLEIRDRERRMGRTWTPIVAVTANSDPEQARGYFAAGMDAVVAKPVAPAALYEAVATTMRSRPRAPAAAA